MKKPILIMLALIFAVLQGQAQITLPAPSTAGKVYAKVGLTDVEITYSRPKMKNRMIFGDGSDFLVPFDAMWRTGANNGTMLKTSTAMQFGSQTLPAGEYLVLTTPGAKEWKMTFYKDISMGGNLAEFKEDQVAISVTGASTTISPKVETLSFQISDLLEDNTGASIELSWENTVVKVPFKVDFDKTIMASIEKHTKVDPQNLVAAADYYFNSGKDVKQAQVWIEQYFASDPSLENQFWNLYLMAQIQQAAGDKKAAKASAEKSLAKAKANSGGDFGYIKRNEDLLSSLK